jgi:hypothetical protein
VWWNTVTKGTGYVDDLGNDIVAVQDGPGGVIESTNIIMNVIDKEKDLLPVGK